MLYSGYKGYHLYSGTDTRYSPVVFWPSGLICSAAGIWLMGPRTNSTPCAPVIDTQAVHTLSMITKRGRHFFIQTPFHIRIVGTIIVRDYLSSFYENFFTTALLSVNRSPGSRIARCNPIFMYGRIGRLHHQPPRDGIVLHGAGIGGFGIGFVAKANYHGECFAFNF